MYDWSLLMLAPGDRVALRADVVDVFDDEIEICLHVKHGARYRMHVPKSLITAIMPAACRAGSANALRQVA